MTSRPFRSLLALAGPAVLAAAALAPAAAADDGAGPWRDHPGAALAVHVALALLALVAVAGVGCVVAATNAALPRLASAMDRRAREGGGGALLSGSLVALGALLASAALAHAGPVARGAAVLVGGAALLLVLAGALGTLPLVGERVLGAAGERASPLRRAVTGAVVLGLGLVPGLLLRVWPLALLVGLVAAGWPLGVALSALLGRRRGPWAAPEGPPPA